MDSSAIRVYSLARDLDQPSHAVLELARRMGFDVKNVLSSLSPAQRAALEEALGRLPPDEPPLGVPSKLRPRGPGPGIAHQELRAPPSEEDEPA
jgi:hypothetical protein